MSYFKKFLLFVAAIVFLGQAQAKSIQVPGKIDFDKTIAGFSYSHTERSATGKKVGLSGRLMANGSFFVSGIYIGETFDSCSSRGGEAVATLNKSQREALIKMALQSYNENQILTSEAGPLLSVELGQEMGNISITKYGPHTILFKKELLSVIQKTFDDSNLRQTALELSVSLEKDKIIFNIKNIGKIPAKVLLPDDASEHFFFRKTEDELIGLKYAVKPAIRVLKLNVNQSLKVALQKPAISELEKTIFIYDNMATVYNDDPDLDSSPKVQICNTLK